MPDVFEEDEEYKIPNKYKVPDILFLDFVTDELAGGDVTKYEYIDNKFDLEDYYLWLAWRNRKGLIDKHFIDKAKNK